MLPPVISPRRIGPATKGPETRALVLANTGSLEVLGDFHADHPQFEISVERMDRAHPWFGRPDQNGAGISQIALDDMAAGADDQTSAEEAAAEMTDAITGQPPR